MINPLDPPHYRCCLALHGIQLQARIGLLDEERRNPLPVELDVRIYFDALPECCADDETPGICYGLIATRLKDRAEQGEFKLIEYLAMEMHKVVRHTVAERYADRDVRLWLRARKMVVPIAFVAGGASFIYSDLPAGASVVEPA